MTDQVVLVNEQDIQVGVMDKVDAHRGDGQLHRAISVYLFRKTSLGKIELLVQQRSDKKIVGAKQWANTACGNVWPGEEYVECAHRRLNAELGIEEQLKLRPVYKFIYQVKCNAEFSEHEMDQVFVGWWDGSTRLNPEEVATTNWLEFDALVTTAEQEKWQPQQVVAYHDLELAPWFVWMLRDKNLIKQLENFLAQV